MNSIAKTSLLILICLLGLSCGTNTEDGVNIIPKPQQVEMGSGHFLLSRSISIYADIDDPNLSTIVGFLSSHLAKVPKSNIQVNEPGAEAEIHLELLPKKTDQSEEAYTLAVERNRILLQASDPSGLFYAYQSLLQLMPAEIESANPKADAAWEVPCLRIEDAPRFEYRGMHLDVSRHFMPTEFIKQYIDMLAMNKINKFHWHLTDDQGWRIEVKKYPKLTEIGGCRVERTEMWHVRPFARPDEEATYCGHYTQEEIKEIVQYARDRYIDVVPEIDMPGHCVAILAAYPEHACDNKKYLVIPGGYWPPTDVLCVGDDATVQFMKDILAEVFELFPYKYVHIGGDEAVKTKWETCPKCQKRIKDHNLADVEELQSWFIHEIEEYIIANGKRMIGWEEILQGGLAPEATVMSWTGEEGGIEAANMGHDVIMTPLTHVYFDYYQNNPETEPMAMSNNFTPVRKVYDYEPIPRVLPADKHHHVLGAQANVWTEFIPTPEHAMYMTSTRMAALAEVVWTEPQHKDYADFNRRLQDRFQRFEHLGINYSKGSDIVEFRGHYNEADSSETLAMYSDHPNAQIFYTLKDELPSTSSKLSQGEFTLQTGDTLTAGVFLNGQLLENSITKYYVGKYTW